MSILIGVVSAVVAMVAMFLIGKNHICKTQNIISGVYSIVILHRIDGKFKAALYISGNLKTVSGYKNNIGLQQCIDEFELEIENHKQSTKKAHEFIKKQSKRLKR